MADWDPVIYERYKAQRDRPAFDLLLQIPPGLKPKEVWDLGCGTGELAALLAARHPAARVHGLDSSAAMLETAARRPADVDWRLGDIAAFAPETPPDLIFTNAALQWVPDHTRLFPALIETLAPGGVLACQMPVNGWGRWRELLQETANEPRFASALAGVSRRTIEEPETYYGLLAPLCPGGADVWATEYLHLLQGEDPVLDWARGTWLLPYIDALEGPDQEAFLDALAVKFAAAYPPGPGGVTLMPFRRLFIVARR